MSTEGELKQKILGEVFKSGQHFLNSVLLDVNFKTPTASNGSRVWPMLSTSDKAINYKCPLREAAPRKTEGSWWKNDMQRNVWCLDLSLRLKQPKSQGGKNVRNQELNFHSCASPERPPTCLGLHR